MYINKYFILIAAKILCGSYFGFFFFTGTLEEFKSSRSARERNVKITLACMLRVFRRETVDEDIRHVASSRE